MRVWDLAAKRDLILRSAERASRRMTADTAAKRLSGIALVSVVVL
jgi:hypothetical protein